MERFVFIIIFALFASPAIAKDSIELFYNVQRPGGDYTHFRTSDAAECAYRCEMSSHCRAFDYHRSDSSCWLKSRVYPSRPYHGVVSGSKKSPRTMSTRLMTTKMVLSYDTHRPGGDYARFHTHNQQICSEECRKDRRCVAFDFTMMDSMCYLKNWQPPASPYQGVISGLKQQKPVVKQISSRMIRSVQRALVELGYNPGPIDGMMGRNTRVALRQYQREYNLPVTGRVDEATLISLRIIPPLKTAPAPTPPPEQKTEKISPQQSSTVFKGEIMKVAVFPWILNGDSKSLMPILKDGINFQIQESDTFQLKSSYYKMDNIPKLDVGDSWNLYNVDKPNVPLVQQIAQEQGIDIAVLGSMDIYCKWSDACLVKQMEIMLVDIKTGEITTAQGGSEVKDAREIITSNVATVFGKFNQELANSSVTY